MKSPSDSSGPPPSGSGAPPPSDSGAPRSADRGVPPPADRTVPPRDSGRYSPLWQLILARLREFWREPETIFWVYGFPVLMVVALGIAFRQAPVERVSVDVEAGPQAERVLALLRGAAGTGVRFEARVCSGEECGRRLRTAKTDLVVTASVEGGRPAYAYRFDPSRPEGRLARGLVDDALQRAVGRRDVARVLPDRRLVEPGSRYIDFLVPGLLGMSLMGGGLWGVGYVVVDMRIRKLLKRYLATPMRRSHFLGGILLSRLLFMVPELFLLLLFARITFDVRVYGSLLAVAGLIFLGAFTFAGIGLVVACRARTLETVSGLMNLVMLPMWVLSGIFFSAERFPAAAQPLIQALPLTALNDALRAVTLEGASLASQAHEVGLLALWGGVTFVLALRWFRWT